MGISVTNFTVISKLKNCHWLCDGCNHEGVFDELREINIIKAQINQLNEKFEILSRKVEGQPTRTHEAQGASRNDMVNFIREEREIEKRKNNLCFFNMPESADDNVALKNLCVDKLGLQPQEVQITETIRVGRAAENKPKVLIAKFSDSSSRRKVLRNANKLRNYVPQGSTLKIFISPDYTKIQQVFQKALRAELKDRREAGENVYIKDNKIVQRPQNSQTTNE